MEVDKDVCKILKDFHSHQKVIGMTCISPVLAAKVFAGVPLAMTLGGVTGKNWPYAGASQLATKLGHRMQTSCRVEDVVSDPDNKIVTTPAYM